MFNSQRAGVVLPRSAPLAADLLLYGALVLTMDLERQVFNDGAVAVKDGSIIDVGNTEDVRPRWHAERALDLSGMVITPGLVNAHIHLTGDNLFPGLQPDDVANHDRMATWVLPAYEHSTPEDERAAARLTILQMLRHGTTAFIEAGTCFYPSAVLDGLKEFGMKGAIGAWVSDGWGSIKKFAATTDQAIAKLHEATSLPVGSVKVWPSILGSNLCSDDLYREASRLAHSLDRQWTFHLSPTVNDGDYFRQHKGSDPLLHLEKLGVLDERCVIGHAIHISVREVEAINRSGANVAFSPTSALRLASGITAVGRHLDLSHVALGTDAQNASNHVDLLRAADLACLAYAEARKGPPAVTAERALEWLFLGGARALNFRSAIGSVEIGKRADIAVFNPGLPVFNVANSLVHGAPRAVHSFIDGRHILQSGHVYGEEEIIADAIKAGQNLARRAGLPLSTGWKPAPKIAAEGGSNLLPN
jgi:5-methylthioadenosine/S-adenosylhomocysteine deaminase